MRTKVNKVTVMHSSSYRSSAIMELNSLNFICVCMSFLVMSSESGVYVQAIFFYGGSNTKCHISLLMFILFRQHYVLFLVR